MTALNPILHGMIPCGACRAFIPIEHGCLHWRSPVKPGQGATIGRDGSTRAHLLSLAAVDPMGLVSVSGNARLKHAAIRAEAAGQLEHSGTPSVYRITARGREALKWHRESERRKAAGIHR